MDNIGTACVHICSNSLKSAKFKPHRSLTNRLIRLLSGPIKLFDYLFGHRYGGRQQWPTLLPRCGLGHVLLFLELFTDAAQLLFKPSAPSQHEFC